MSCSRRIGGRPPKSSGASAKVNAILNQRAVTEIVPENTSAVPIDNNRCRRPATRNAVYMYVATTVNHRIMLCVGKKLLAMSTSPACFWPVWFQRRDSLSATSIDIDNQPGGTVVWAVVLSLC